MRNVCEWVQLAAPWTLGSHFLLSHSISDCCRCWVSSMSRTLSTSCGMGIPVPLDLQYQYWYHYRQKSEIGTSTVKNLKLVSVLPKIMTWYQSRYSYQLKIWYRHTVTNNCANCQVRILSGQTALPLCLCEGRPGEQMGEQTQKVRRQVCFLCSCQGRRGLKKKLEDRIVGGYDAEQNKPWAARVWINQMDLLCGGSLINKRCNNDIEDFNSQLFYVPMRMKWSNWSLRNRLSLAAFIFLCASLFFMCHVMSCHAVCTL